jgi:hypothetical protein
MTHASEGLHEPLATDLVGQKSSFGLRSPPAYDLCVELNKTQPFRLTIKRGAITWLCFGAAPILPNLHLRTRAHPAMKVILATYWVLLLCHYC